MQNSSVSIIPTGALSDLNRQIDRALIRRDLPALAGVRAVTSWLLTLEPSIPVIRLDVRAAAAARHLGGCPRV